MTHMQADTSYEILAQVLRHVAFEGWTDQAVTQAARALNLPQGTELIYAPGGALGLIRLWSDQLDADMRAAAAARGFDNMRIRDKVTEAVWIRLNLLTGHEDAARRALARLSLPDAGSQGAAQLWSSADAIWTMIGDVSEDYNYYTKRAILSGVIGSTLLAWLADETADKMEARRFLERRIGNVMQFETAKAKTLNALSGAPKPQEISSVFKSLSRRRRRRA